MSNVRFKERAWPDVAKSYQRMLERYNLPFEPMFRLVKDIADSPYAFGLYGNTSMWDVLVVQTEEYDPYGEILKIKYDPSLRLFTFELLETASTKSKRWTRTAAPEDAYRTFERFLQLKKWFALSGSSRPTEPAGEPD